MWTLRKTIEFHGWFDFYTLQNAQERTCRLRNEVYGWFLLNLITSCPRSSIWPLRSIDFPLRSGSSQMLDPDWECQWFGTENPCFSQLELFRILRIRFWALEITRIAPGKCQKTSGIIPSQEIHNRWKSKICFKNRLVHILDQDFKGRGQIVLALSAGIENRMSQNRFLSIQNGCKHVRKWSLVDFRKHRCGEALYLMK